MNFELNVEQLMLRTSAREFLSKECSKKHVREMMEDEKGYSPILWGKMAKLGWQGMAFEEQYGGMGSSFLDLVVLLEEMGRALVPGPFLSTVVHAGRTILNAGNEGQKKTLLNKISLGKSVMALAFMEENGGIEASDINLNATLSGNDFILNGTKLFVSDAQVTDTMVVVARTKDGANKEDGITLFLVDTTAKGVKVHPLKTITGEKLCEVNFERVMVPKDNILGEIDGGWMALNTTLEEVTIAESAWMLGGARRVLETTTDYAKKRIQFGRPIGSFQAIQHKLANVAMEVEGCTALVYYAAWTVNEKDPGRTLAASMAKSWCNESFTHAVLEGVQIHGGIGFTWDHDMHLYLKRAKSSEVAFGNSNYHREKIARLLQV
jgi:alkylation response protein AidB-like acyl-CoA dehydrogenase